MIPKHLAIYLNDHLAGATAGIELLEHLAVAYDGTDLEQFAVELQAEVVADRKELEALTARLQISQSAPRKVSAWIAEKFAQLKLRMDDHTGGPLHLLEATEALSLGIEGKRLMWRSLATASEAELELRGPDYDRLTLRAEEQRRRVEIVRLEAATAALGAAI
jgi:hypothetical protein